MFLNIAKQYRLQKKLIKLIFLIGRWYTLVSPPQISVARLAKDNTNGVLARSHRNRRRLFQFFHISDCIEEIALSLSSAEGLLRFPPVMSELRTSDDARD